jgi:oxygen tolerance protein BatD
MRRRTGEPRARSALALAAAVTAALAAAAPPPARADDDVSVRATVDRTELAEDEVVLLTIAVEADEAPTALDLREAELPFVVRSRSEARGAAFSIGGGAGVRLRRSVTWTIALAPRRTGELVIPALSVTVKGAPRTTEPIRVRVLPAGARPDAPPPEPRGGTWRGWERDLVLEVEVDRREAFLGEQVTATVWLLSPVGVAQYEGFRPPPLDGFWAEELERPRQLEFRVRTRNGVPVRAYLVQRIALFPTRAGEAEIGPYELELAVRLGGASFLAPLGELRRAHRRSAPVRLTVKPLPPGAPPGFEAVNVGAWRLEARAAETEGVAGQPVTIRVTASGEGNVHALALPAIPPVDGVRRFEPSAREEATTRGTRLGGTRTVETVMVPDAAGELVVPALAWPTFDPRTGAYAVLRTAPLALAVRPAPAAPAPPPAPDPLAGLRPPRPPGRLARPAPPPWQRAPFLALVALPPLALALVLGWDALRRRAERGAPARRARGAGARAARRLRAAERHRAAGERTRFLDEVGRALAGYAEDRLGRPVAGLTRETLAEALVAAGARPAGVAALAQALDTCDAARFGGAAADEEVRARASDALARLERRDAAGGAA